MSGSDKGKGGGGVRNAHKNPALSKAERLRKFVERRREKYDSFDETKYNKIYFDEKTGGYVVEEKARYEQGQKSKNAKEVYDKEQKMSVVLAKHGKRVEHLSDASGGHDVRVNGVSADLKKTKGANNLANYARKATRKQGAKLVVFQIDNLNHAVHFELNKLSDKGIHGWYFITGREEKLIWF